jgi:hypothetical protein
MLEASDLGELTGEQLARAIGPRVLVVDLGIELVEHPSELRDLASAPSARR